MKYFSPSILIAVLGAPYLVLAQTSTGANAFTLDPGFSASAGSPVTLTWGPTTGGTVTLVLRSGASNNLDAGATIASGIQNTGSYTWQVPASVTRGSDYTIEIIDDQDPTKTNYSAYFVIESTNTVASSTAVSGSRASSLAQPTTSLSSIAPSSTSSLLIITGTASSSSTLTTTVSSSGTASTHASSTSASPSSSSSSSRGSAPRATAMAGMLGMVALGALAL